MVVKVFISGISASKEVKKNQLRAQFLLDSYKIKYELVDISDPLCEAQREKMLASAKRRGTFSSENNSTTTATTTSNQQQAIPQPPQFFNDDVYCGDYEDLETANDNNELFHFLKLEEDITIENGDGDENDLFQSGTNGTVNETNDYDNSVVDIEQQKQNGNTDSNDNNSTIVKKKKIIDENGEEIEEEEAIQTQVREQITVNGVVYDIPPDRKINIGGKLIDVDQLMAEEGEDVDIDKVDDKLKEGLVKSDNKEEEEEEEEEDEEEEEEEEE